MRGYLVLENGEVFEGERFGYNKECISEIVFNTSMAGYTEVFTDPSYCGQGICMTYPLIGNYGMTEDDYESSKIWADAIFIHELATLESNFRAENDLNSILIKNKIPGLTEINTRKLTKTLRENGTMKGMITNNILDIPRISKKIEEYNSINFVDEVSTKETYKIGNGKIKIALIDYGAKKNIIRSLLKRDCIITVFPSKTKNIDVSKFDGIVLSNGPGDPAKCNEEVEVLKKLYQTDKPILGICLGHQLMGIATGAKTTKLKYGHRGPNQPVKDLKQDAVHITSQNHGYCILEESINPEIAEISHININDNTVEGLKYKGKNIVTVQFHPEACPGPHDSDYIFDDFINTIIQTNNT